MKRPLDQVLPPELRNELLRSRQAGHDYDALAKLPQLRAALNAATATGRDPLSEPESATLLSRIQPAVSKLAPLAWKLALIAALGVSAFVAWPALQKPEAPAPSSPTVQQAQPEAQAPAPPAPAVQPARPVPAPEVATTQDPRSAQSPAVRSSRREIAQLVRIRALLERDPRAAYQLAQRSEREFPQGLLSEERQALQVVALAKSGATEAAERTAREFFKRYPQSPMRDRIEAALLR